MESYLEFMVKKKMTAKDVGIIALTVFALAFIVVLISLWIGPASGFVILAFGAYGAYLLITGRRREFEYILTNDQLDVDEIIAGRRRRRLCSFDLEEMELCARVSDPDKKGEMNRVFAKKIEAASAPDAENAYFAVFGEEQGLNLLIFEPNDRILDGMALYARSKISR